MKKHVTLDNLKMFLGCLDGRFIQQKAGFGLSSNDFTDAYKERVKSIEPDAEKNVITSICIADEDIDVTDDRKAHIEAIGETDIKELSDEVNDGIGGDANFEVATSSDVYDIMHS